MALEIVNVLPIVSARAGGPPAFVGPLALELQRRGHRVLTLTTDLALPPGARGQRPAHAAEILPSMAAAGYSAFATRRPRRLLYSPALAAEAKAAVRAADVVHIHSLWLYPQYAAYRAAVHHHVPYVVSPHGALDPALAARGRLRKQATSALWQRRMFERATLIHVTTGAEAELIPDVAPNVPRAVVPLGVDLSEQTACPDPAAFRRNYLDGYQGLVVLFLGRLTFKKGIDLLIRAFTDARPEIDCRLVVAGPDDERLAPSLHALAERGGVGGDVVFTGPLFGEARAAAFAAADVFALTSHTENFGVAVIEAVAAGCPALISSAVNLAPEMGAAGAAVVVELNEGSITAGLRRALGDPGLRDRLRVAGREFARRYELGAVAGELERMYERVAGRS